MTIVLWGLYVSSAVAEIAGLLLAIGRVSVGIDSDDTPYFETHSRRRWVLPLVLVIVGVLLGFLGNVLSIAP